MVIRKIILAIDEAVLETMLLLVKFWDMYATKALTCFLKAGISPRSQESAKDKHFKDDPFKNI